MPAEVVIYTTKLCGYCWAALRLLEKKKIAFTQHDVSGDRDKRAWLLSVTGRRTVPQIFINGAAIGGYDDLSALDDDGELDGLLAAAPP